jgi:rhomboid family GlyGly-CTERM serine protease
MLLLNLELFLSGSVGLTSCLESLQFDRDAILTGQVWRLITGNMVHWSAEHFLLDVGAFLIVGVLYERHLNRRYPWILLTAALAVGCGVLLLRPDMQTYRGLSGVDSGQFSAALGVEALLAARDPRRWIWVAPAAAVFLVKTVYESATGMLFFGTESLGDLGQPIPLAHTAGTAAALAWFLSMTDSIPHASRERRRNSSRSRSTSASSSAARASAACRCASAISRAASAARRAVSAASSPVCRISPLWPSYITSLPDSSRRTMSNGSHRKAPVSSGASGTYSLCSSRKP